MKHRAAALLVLAFLLQSLAYRGAKARTTTAKLTEPLGPGAPSLGLRFTGPDGAVNDRAQIIQVSVPGAVRVPIPVHAPGASPAGLRPPSWQWTLTALGRVGATGRWPAATSRL